MKNVIDFLYPMIQSSRKKYKEELTKEYDQMIQKAKGMLESHEARMGRLERRKNVPSRRAVEIPRKLGTMSSPTTIDISKLKVSEIGPRVSRALGAANKPSIGVEAAKKYLARPGAKAVAKAAARGASRAGLAPTPQNILVGTAIGLGLEAAATGIGAVRERMRAARIKKHAKEKYGTVARAILTRKERGR